MTRRLEALLAPLATMSPKRLRRLRALEILERNGTPAARRLVQVLAEGEPKARLTQEAQNALNRMRRQP